MHRKIALVLLFGLGVLPAYAYECNNGHYVNRSGEVVHSPSCDGEANEKAMATCRDGSTSYSRHRSGTCSGHGGVAQWR
jgi:hypothetical protein